MESKYNITEIITQVGDIGEMISQMKAEGPVTTIEIDIVLEKIRKLYSDVSNLKGHNPPATKKEAKISFDVSGAVESLKGETITLPLSVSSSSQSHSKSDTCHNDDITQNEPSL